MSAKVDPTNQGFHKGFHDSDQVDQRRLEHRVELVFLWSRLGESNPGPTHYERGAPTPGDA